MSDLKKHDGFTLIEIIVSITLVPLVWLAIYISLSANTMLVTQAKHRAQAVFIAQQTLDAMRANGFAALPTFPAQDVRIDTRGTMDSLDDLIGRMTPTWGVMGSHLRRVTVTINWDEITVGGPVRLLTESLTTFISDDSAG